MELFNNFIFHCNVDNSVINKYADKLPMELISVWKEHGFGSLLNGYLKFVNPDDFQNLLNESYFRGNVSIPIFTTGMGDIINWEENRYLRLVKFRRGNFHGISAGFDFFFSDLMDEGFCDRNLDWEQYLEVIKLQEIPAYDECFGYVPLLGLGGAEKAENLQKVRIKEHIQIITEFMGPIE